MSPSEATRSPRDFVAWEVHPCSLPKATASDSLCIPASQTVGHNPIRGHGTECRDREKIDNSKISIIMHNLPTKYTEDLHCLWFCLPVLGFANWLQPWLWTHHTCHHTTHHHQTLPETLRPDLRLLQAMSCSVFTIPKKSSALAET